MLIFVDYLLIWSHLGVHDKKYKMKNTKKTKKQTLDMIRKAVAKSRDFKSVIVDKLTAPDEPLDDTVGVPYLTEPTEHDIKDELVRMDSFAFRDLNE